MEKEKPGMFFVIEGLDGSGKATIAQMVKRNFACWRDNCVHWTRELGGSGFAEEIRKVLLAPRSENVHPKAMLLAFMAARASQYHEMICPFVERGWPVVSDGFDASTYAFQICGEQNHNLLPLFTLLCEYIVGSKNLVYRPHYIYLRCTPEVARARRDTSSLIDTNHYDVRLSEYHQRVYLGYEEFFKRIQSLSEEDRPSEHPVTYIDATRNVDEVYADVRRVIVNKLIEQGINIR